MRNRLFLFIVLILSHVLNTKAQDYVYSVTVGLRGLVKCSLLQNESAYELRVNPYYIERAPQFPRLFSIMSMITRGITHTTIASSSRCHRMTGLICSSDVQ